MPSPQYSNIYSNQDNLTHLDLSGDFYNFKNYIDNSLNYSKPSTIVFLNDVSFISFDNSLNINNLNVLDLNQRKIYNTKTLKLSDIYYKYIRFNFRRLVTLNNLQIYDNNNSAVSFKLWTRSMEKYSSIISYDTSTDISSSVTLNDVSSIVIETSPSIKGIPKYIKYNPVLTDKLFYSDPNLALINYYYIAGVDSVNSFDAPVFITRNNMRFGTGFYGDPLDNFYTLEQFNDNLYNNIQLMYGNTLFDVSSIQSTNETNIYNIKFSYTKNTSNEYNYIYVSTNSLLFTLLGITDFSLFDISDISVNTTTVKTIKFTHGLDISLNFTYDPYKNATLGFNNINLNDTYEDIGHTTDKIIDKNSTTNTETTTTLTYSYPIINFDNDNLCNRTNNGAQIVVADASSIDLNTYTITSSKLLSNDTYVYNTVNNNIDISYLDASSGNIGTIKISNILDTNVLDCSNILVNKIDVSGVFNVNNATNLNITYPNTIDISNIEKDIFKSYSNSFIKYNNDNLVFNKNLFIRDISCLDISSVSVKYILNDKDISLNNLNVSNNFIFKNNLTVNVPDICDNFCAGIDVNNNGKIKMAYYVNQKKSDSNYNGYRMEIGPYSTVSIHNAGWYIKMIGENNKYCKTDAYIRLVPGRSQDMFNSDTSGITVFEIDSDYLKHSSSNQPTVYSDDRVKHNEVNIINGLDIINKLKPLTYLKTNMIYDSSINAPYLKKSSGYIAQHVKKIPELSHLVYGDEYNYRQEPNKMSINYTGIQPFMTKSIQELIDEVSGIKVRISNLNS